MVKHQKKVSTGITKAGNVFVKFYCRGKRYRFSNEEQLIEKFFQIKRNTGNKNNTKLPL